MDVKICSRTETENLLKTVFPQNMAVISFFDPLGNYKSRSLPPVNYENKAERLFQISLYDIDLSVLPKYGLDYDTYFPEADRLAEFIFKAKNDGLNILCQCEYGESRSSGCAAAILEYFYQTGISIFTDYRYYPNQVIYHKVFEALRKYSVQASKKQAFFPGNWIISSLRKMLRQFGITVCQVVPQQGL